MLRLPHHHLAFPHPSNNSGHLELSPVPHENDELIAAIEAREEAWQLDGAPDVQGLDTFWSGVQDDLTKDPDWFNFASDDE